MTKMTNNFLSNKIKNKLSNKPHKTEPIYTKFSMLLNTNSFEYTLII